MLSSVRCEIALFSLKLVSLSKCGHCSQGVLNGNGCGQVGVDTKCDGWDFAPGVCGTELGQGDERYRVAGDGP